MLSGLFGLNFKNFYPNDYSSTPSWDISSQPGFWSGALYKKGESADSSFMLWLDISQTEVTFNSYSTADPYFPWLSQTTLIGNFVVDQGELKGGSVTAVSGAGLIGSSDKPAQNWKYYNYSAPYEITQDIAVFSADEISKNAESYWYIYDQYEQSDGEGKWKKDWYGSKTLLNSGKESGSPVEYFGAIDSATNNWSQAELKLKDIGFTTPQVDEFLGFTNNYESLDFLQSASYLKAESKYQAPSEQVTPAIQPDGGNTTSSGDVGLKKKSSVYDQYYSALTSGDAALTSKKINWKTFSDFSTVDSSFYSALEWSAVNISKLQKFQGSAIDWNQVQYTEFSSKQYKQTNWSQVSVSSFTSQQYQDIDWGQVSYRGSKSISYSQVSWSEVDFGDFSVKTFKQVDWSQVATTDLTAQQYSEINWGQVAFKGSKSVNYSSLNWSQVDFGDFSAKTFKQVDWSQVKTSDLTSQQYSDINWGQVKFKGSKAPTLSDLDLSLVIGSSTFSKKTAKQIDWTQVSTDDLSSSALSKLSGMGVKKKGVNVAELLKPGTKSKELSFAGVGQAEGAALVTTDQAEGALAFIAAASPESLF